jgi:hypothetical protein
MSTVVDVKHGARDLMSQDSYRTVWTTALISAMLLRLEHARLNQRNVEETIERRYRQYLSIDPQMRLWKNAPLVLRGCPIGDEIGGGHTRAIKEGAMIRVEETRRNDKRDPFLVHVDQRPPSSSTTQIRNAESVRHMAVRENKQAKVVAAPSGTKVLVIPSSNCFDWTLLAQ